MGARRVTRPTFVSKESTTRVGGGGGRGRWDVGQEFYRSPPTYFHHRFALSRTLLCCKTLHLVTVKDKRGQGGDVGG